MLMDLFIVPTKGLINEAKATRTVESSTPIVHRYYMAKDWTQINKTPKKSLFYGIAYDNEWFDKRLIMDIKAVLIFSRGIDMFVVYTAEGGGKVEFQPRIFDSKLVLDPDIKNQPLPYNHEHLKYEKLIGGWLYID